jgi:hypothetical protein
MTETTKEERSSVMSLVRTATAQSPFTGSRMDQ